jgi:hypothetical protein
MKPYGSTHPANEETATDGRGQDRTDGETIRAPRGKEKEGTFPEMEASDASTTPGED